MLDSVYAGIAAVTHVIQSVGSAGRFIFDLNNQFVAAVVHYLGLCISFGVRLAGLVKVAVLAVGSFVTHCVAEVYLFLESAFILAWKLTALVLEFSSSAYTNTSAACVAAVNFVTSSVVYVKTCVIDMYNVVAVGASNSISFVVTALTTLFLLVSSLGAACVSFINGVWYGLGYIISSVAYFPTFLSQSVGNAWRRLVEGVAGVLLATTKETYLGVIVLCLIYLTLSNFLRYFLCRSLPLFSRRTRRRRPRQSNADPWQFDLGFESDFEDVYGQDADGRDRRPPWLNNGGRAAEGDAGIDDNNSNFDANDSDTSDDDGDNGIDDSDGGNDSDEYTIASDDDEDDSSDADSVNSLNSQTFSTGSSDHDIEVQLPPVDQHYSLRSRSSTPARQPGKSGPLSSPEDFDREMERERDKRKCVVCQDEIKSVLVLPCRHMCMCVMCANQIVRSRAPGRSRACPLCRMRITKVMDVYV